MHIRKYSRRGLRAAVLLVGMALGVLSGCSSDKKDSNASFNIVCEQNGLCECTDNSQCANNQICVNGWCHSMGTSKDSVDEGLLTPVTDVSFETVIPPGAFMAPCTEDDECDSLICLEVAAGVSVCTQECIADCPNGWECRGISQGGDQLVFYCFPPVDRLCQPCLTDVSCTGQANLCVDIDGTLNCGRDCATIACPNGYSCDPVQSIGGTKGLQCLPDNGHCQCTPENAGKQFQCDVENEFGLCPGQQMCMEDGSLSECNAATPALEACDGEDNDCDGFIDEDIPAGECSVSNDDGTCIGTVMCIAGIGEVCNVAMPQAEICDTLDNDCDEEIDEDFKTPDGLYGLLNHCGQCGNQCEGQFANAAEVICDTEPATPKCRVAKCVGGFVLTLSGICLPAIHHLCEPCAVHEACVGAQDKCMLMNPTDTQTFCGRDCSEGNEYDEDCPLGYDCQTVTVEDLEYQQCVPVNGTCDCSELSQGQIKPCAITNEFGTCYGIATCNPLLGWSGCNAVSPEEEVCDGTDNDCDGIIDEELTGGHCKVENEFGSCMGTEICLGFEGGICTAATPAAEVCDGLDNDCNGLLDDPFATNILNADDEVIAVVYDQDNDNCGGCGLTCKPSGPVTQAQCGSEGLTVFCQVTECQPGYYPVEGTTCVPLPTANLCLPCAQDSDCMGPDDACVEYDSGLFCGRDCSPASVYSNGEPGDAGFCSGIGGEQGCCPDGYLCIDSQCLRASNDCECNADGKIRPCNFSNDFGLCTGFEECVASGPEAGWQPCSAAAPAQETCDGLDNDCDGLIDQADPTLDVTDVPGYPDCFNISSACTGIWTCAAGENGEFGFACSAPDPTEEVCNGFDDDCDGDIDEGFVDDDGKYTLLAHCGQCGLNCTQAIGHLALAQDGSVLDGAVVCEMVGTEPNCVPVDCQPGHFPFPNGGQATICLSVPSANCQPCGQADDCPGIGHACVEVGADDGNYCAARCDEGSPFAGCTGEAGNQDCCPDGFVCSGIDGTPAGQLFCMPSSATCQCQAGNGGMERPCTVVDPISQTSCFGISTCDDLGQGTFGWGLCDTSANVEICDGKDNNCSGEIDEGFKVDGLYASNIHCGQCGKNCLVKWSVSKQHAMGKCDASLPGGPDCVLGDCVEEMVGGGTFCHSNDDCTGDSAGSSCLPLFNQCGQACVIDGDCDAGTCLGSWCSPSCNGDNQCQQLFGDWTQCIDGSCRTAYQFVDLDDWTGNGCECAATVELEVDEPDLFADYPLPGELYADRDCDGIDGDLETALFVSAGSNDGDGSIGSPFGTIQAAIDAFDNDQHSHILCTLGSYHERLVLKNGASVYGGYSPNFWQRDIALFPSVIDGPAPDFSDPAALPGTIHADGIFQPTVLAGFTIHGYDVPAGAAAAGKPSYAVYLSSSSSALLIVNNWIIGGQGGAGQAGTNGDPGDTGGGGGPGLHSAECVADNCQAANCNPKTCSGHTQPGGSGGTNAACGGEASGCPGMEAEGAEYTQIADNPPAGCVYPSGGQQATYAGGPASHCKYDCYVNWNMVGHNGGMGSDGSAGNGGGGCSSSLGSFDGTHWSGSTAEAGSSGTMGTGGMGGSSGAYITNNKSNACTVGNPLGDLGGSGGGGGGGGCGGNGGQPGITGGASIAVAVVSGLNGTAATLAGNVILRGTGGPGGNGGNGGSGGTGGAGGKGGGAGWPAWCAGVGGAGGRGGDGGAGGGGGGGCGGPSIGLATVGIEAIVYASSNSFPMLEANNTGGPGGAGGLSMDPAKNGATGTTGVTSNVEVF